MEIGKESIHKVRRQSLKEIKMKRAVFTINSFPLLQRGIGYIISEEWKN